MGIIRPIAAASASTVALASLLVASPASATTIDVAGHQLKFSNAVDQSILESAAVGDDYLYENVATIDGTVIDALVTVTAFSDNSLGSGYYETLTQQNIDDLNITDSNSVDVPGCYTNADYQDDRDNGWFLYEFVNFVPSDLADGEAVEYIDGYEGDAAWEDTISTSLYLCDPTFEGTDGFVDINVQFQVDGSPVTLENLALNATDIDWAQEVTFWDPAPSTFTTSGDDTLVTIEDHAASDDYVTFVGPADGSIDGEEDRYVGQVTYDSVSEINYTFRLVDDTGGSLQMAFESYFDEPLASTGVDTAPTGLIGLGALVVGGAIVIARRARRRA